MPSYILKPDRDVDFYVEWSTVVDNATRVGPVREFPDVPDERLIRADRQGTSCKGFEREGDGYLPGGWDDEELIVTNTNRRDHPFYWLDRTNLLAYGRLLYEGKDTEAEALLRPLHDEDDPPCEACGKGR